MFTAKAQGTQSKRWLKENHTVIPALVEPWSSEGFSNNHLEFIFLSILCVSAVIFSLRSLRLCGELFVR